MILPSILLQSLKERKSTKTTTFCLNRAKVDQTYGDYRSQSDKVRDCPYYFSWGRGEREFRFLVETVFCGDNLSAWICFKKAGRS